MAIDYRKEQIYLIRSFADRVGMKYNTLRAYIKRGVVGVSGDKVRLEVCKTPGGEATSYEAYYRFLDRINGVCKDEFSRVE